MKYARYRVPRSPACLTHSLAQAARGSARPLLSQRRRVEGHWYARCRARCVCARAKLTSHSPRAACRAALQSKFFEFGELGYLALGSASPVIYTTYPISSTIRARLSFPASAVREMKHFSSLEDEVKKDVANGLTPLIVFASIGTGHRDDIVSLRRTCDEFGVWLHVEGYAHVRERVSTGSIVCTHDGRRCYHRHRHRTA